MRKINCYTVFFAFCLLWMVVLLVRSVTVTNVGQVFPAFMFSLMASLSCLGIYITYNE
ncbi:hypothetical protein [Bacteroides uniformis]|uniref:hypothetical protein n=1 Tax=Bacteroides uniformis TaxID=820 RepID=UPI00129CC6F4|nr:hypothetical protein [Bacteroides uniformis]MBT9865389.1 hypothetical protein [Bacteroides uniformis]DAH20723.1 MAG TPA: hypothetical protein [Caudoviricetes sp.]DAN49592.1 MAG TPA: hypothetical protein [Caudoviricetes sp.]